MLFYLLYGILLSLFAIYSYVLLDPNITFLNTQAWTMFRDAAVQIGYHQRPLSWGLYLGLLLSLYGAHWWIMKRGDKINPVRLSFLIGGILIAAYPFLSHDFFNYMFDAKILTYYHQNPYLHKALDYPDDTWLRFMHWVHRPYPYGPVYLAISAVPAFLGLGKFLIHFFLLKIVCSAFYVLTVWSLVKLNRRDALFVATHPLVLIEGLIMGHNEILALGLGAAGLVAVMQKKRLFGGTLMALSTGIKFMSFPYLGLLGYDRWWMRLGALVGTIGVLVYASYSVVVQPWYFLNLFLFIIPYPSLLRILQPLFLGLLLSYYPYIYLGGWDSDEKVALKISIIQGAWIVTALWFIFLSLKEKRGWRFWRDAILSAGERTLTRTSSDSVPDISDAVPNQNRRSTVHSYAKGRSKASKKV